MNREELEKLFDETFESNYYYWLKSIMKEFIFNTIISEVLKDIIKYYWDYNDWCWCCATTLLSDELEKDVKEFYNITL